MNQTRDRHIRTLSQMEYFPTRPTRWMGPTWKPRMETLTWAPEQELASPIPRQVVLQWEYLLIVSFLLAWVFLVLAMLGGVPGFIFSIFGIRMFVLLEKDRRSSRLFVECGIATRGTIVSVERHWYDGRRGPTFIISYDTPTAPNTYTGHRIGGQVGDTLTILYLPEDHREAMPYRACFYKAVARKGNSNN